MLGLIEINWHIRRTKGSTTMRSINRLTILTYIITYMYVMLRYVTY